MNICYGQCDNSIFYPLTALNIQCGINVITTFQYAGDYNITQGFFDQSTLSFSSSAPTDYITLRKVSDNSVIIHGITPLELLYQSSYGGIEMHINTNAACDTQNVNRTTFVNVLCGCNNTK